MPAPTPVHMRNIPIRGPWKTLAADILEVPVSRSNNRYLLVVMAQMGKVVPLKDQNAACILAALIKFFAILLAFLKWYIQFKEKILRVNCFMTC